MVVMLVVKMAELLENTTVVTMDEMTDANKVVPLDTKME
jgi:hypothetical protein